MTLATAPLLTLLPLLAAPLTAPLDGEHTVRFAPAEGLTLTKTITSTTQLDSDEIVLAVNGNEDFFPPMISGAVIEQSMTVTDRYGPAKGGAPLMLTRTFGELTRGFTMEVDIGGTLAEPNGEGKSPLTGSTVVFTKNAETGEYTAAFSGDEERDQAPLERLEPDTDFIGLLPEAALDIGETYAIPTAAFQDVLHAGGDYSFAMEIEGYPGAAGPEPDRMTDYRSCFAEVSDDKAAGTLKEVVEVDGESIAVISLSLKMVGVADHSAAYEEERNEGRPEASQSEISLYEIELSCEGTGELRWNLDKGILVALDFSAELGMDTGLTAISKRSGKEMALELKSVQSGDVTIAVRTQVVEGKR